MHYRHNGVRCRLLVKAGLGARKSDNLLMRAILRTPDTLTSSSSSTTINEKGCNDCIYDNNATSPPEVEENDVNDDHDFPSNYFFKGFLAWCLWGWLPIQQGSAMKSSLFSDAKCDASFGRNTTSRQAIKERKGSVATSPRQQTTATRPQQSLTARQQSDLLVELRNATKDVMQKTYELFEAECVEKEQQKTAFLEVRIIRDNLASLTRKQDLLLQKYYHSTKGPIQNQMKTDLDCLEAQIAGLEASLRILQETELHRRCLMRKVISFCCFICS